LHVLRGNPSKKKIRPELKFRKDGTIPAPPRFIGTGLAREEWLRIAPEVHRLGLLTAADLHPFAVYCIAFERWVKAEEQVADDFTIVTEKGNVIQNPVLGVARRAALDMLRAAAEFGLTPASRSRIAVNEETANDEYDGLIAN
jgi:P27 family predicted phage terminase small subunit